MAGIPLLHLLALALLCCTACLALVATQRWHGRFTYDRATGVQKVHEQPTPRVGGLPMALVMCAASVLLPPAPAQLLQALLLAAIPAFLFGLADDLRLSESTFARLTATLGSGVLAWWLSGALVTRVGVPGLDALLGTWLPLAVAFTAFALAGMANAVNIIDGFNGEAGGVVLLMLAALGFMAQQAGDTALVQVALAAGAAVLGFLVVNYPLGKIFMGDGGAYLLGFIVGVLAVLLLARNPQVSAWAVLLVAAFPVWEVAFSMWRRRRRGRPLMQPDRLHLHMLLERRHTRYSWTCVPRVWRSAAVSPAIWLLACLGAGWGAAAWRSTPGALAGWAVFVAAYGLVYRRLVLFAHR